MKKANAGAGGTKAGCASRMKSTGKKIRVFFLGTNGWFATRTGNTVCAAMEFHDRLIVLDAGDGFQHLPSLLLRLRLKRADVFLSHLHIDHSAGLHLLPRIPRGIRIRIFAHKSYLAALRRLLSHPYTASAGEQWAKVTLHPLHTGENRLPYPVLALPLDHADPCFGFRFSLDGKEIAYCTDTGPCKGISLLARGADALITECALLPGSKPLKEWPHLSPEMAAQEAAASGAHMLILTHFDAHKYPSLSLRNRAQEAARKIFPRTIAAKDGVEIKI